MKDKRLSLRISAENLDVIKHKAEQSKMTLTDYVVKVSMGKQIFIITDLEQVAKELKAIGRNLNQAVMRANQGRSLVINLNETLEEFTKTNQSLQKVLERKRWSDGDS